MKSHPEFSHKVDYFVLEEGIFVVGGNFCCSRYLL